MAGNALLTGLPRKGGNRICGATEGAEHSASAIEPVALVTLRSNIVALH